jgi:hypothetical protein
MERRSGVVCADLIESMRADIALFIMYSLKRLACVTSPAIADLVHGYIIPATTS